MRWAALFLGIMLGEMTAPASEPTQAPGPPGKAAERTSHDGLWVSSWSPPLYPAAKKVFVRDGMTMLQLVQAVGPGWCSPEEGIGILSWAFSDGSLLQAYPAWSPDTILTFEKRDRTAHMWWPTDGGKF